MLDFKKRLWIVQQKEKGKLKDSEIAQAQKTTRRHVQRLWSRYQLHGKEILLDKPRGRKVDAIPLALQEDILHLRKKRYGIHKIRGLLEQDGITISKQKIVRVLKKHDLHQTAPEKGKRYKYIKWERHHSNSLWQTDFCWVGKLGCWITAWLDDHSRLITAAEYLHHATTENALKLFETGARRYGYPREVLSDRGAQYYAAGGENAVYKQYMESKGIRVIYASVKKPTTCGKMERWWKTHNEERWSFSSLQKFVDYYNCTRLHMSLGRKTPYEIWRKDLQV